MRSLIDERAELQAALQEEQRMTTVLRQRLGLAVKENEDLQTCSVCILFYFFLMLDLNSFLVMKYILLYRCVMINDEFINEMKYYSFLEMFVRNYF